MSKQNLIKTINDLKNSEIGREVKFRMDEFSKKGKGNSEEIFNELCFCLLTANFSAERAIKIQEEIGEGFLNLTKEEISYQLSNLGYRFPNRRAEFIFEARKYKNNLKEILSSFDEEKNARDWVVQNIKGTGMKEASHFLRNIGYKNLAIIDFHILDILSKYNIIEKPKTMNRKKYLEIEEAIENLSRETNTNLGELDLYLWYKETGKILK